MPPIFKSKKSVVGSAKKVAVPARPSAKAAATPAKPTSSPQKITVKVSVPRPIFRVFECLVHLEQAKFHLNQVGISIGEDPEVTFRIKEALEIDLVRLVKIYRTYWRQINIEVPDK